MKSIQSKILFMTIALTTIIFIGFGLLNYAATKIRIENDLANFGEITVKRISQYIGKPFWGMDEKLVGESLNSEMLDKQIYAIIVRDIEGKKIYKSKKRDANWEIIDNHEDIQGNFIINSKPIAYNGKTIGSIEIYLSKKFMVRELRMGLYNIFFTLIILNTVLFFGMFILLRKTVLGPIKILTDAAEQISIGNIDTEIIINTKDEIGTLAEAFNRMALSLTVAMKRLSKK
ncbi:MAG: HAMP domain-containing protein [Desulfobacterales bacterium]|nr:HAMP domain-containing protein [Desulfobacterales bacterium]